VKFRLHSPISKAIDLELEREPSALDHHFQSEVQVIKLHAPRCR